MLNFSQSDVSKDYKIVKNKTKKSTKKPLKTPPKKIIIIIKKKLTKKKMPECHDFFFIIGG